MYGTVLKLCKSETKFFWLSFFLSICIFGQAEAEKMLPVLLIAIYTRIPILDWCQLSMLHRMG